MNMAQALIGRIMAGKAKAPTWHDVWRHVDERRQELGWTRRELYDNTSISNMTYRKMNDGVGLQQSHKIHGMCRGLGWSTDSVDRILAGGEPEVVDPVPGDVTPTGDAYQLVLDELRESARAAELRDERIAQLLETLIGELRRR
jgi:hypothetical protein